MKMQRMLLAFCWLSRCWALSPSDEAKVTEAAREFIRDHLKAPATAIFSRETICSPLGKPDADEAYGLAPTPECLKPKAAKVGDGADGVVYRASVDAQNSFGAMIRTKYQLLIFLVNGKWAIHDSAEVAKLLWASCRDLNAAYRQLGRGTIRDCDAEYPAAAKR